VRIAITTILVASILSILHGDSIELSPGILWEYSLAYSDAIGALDNLISASEMLHEASGRLPDPQIKFAWAPLPLETRNGPALFSVTLMQKIPWPGCMKQERLLSNSQVELAILDRDLAALELRTSIAEVWAEMFLLRSTSEFLEGESERLRILLAAAGAGYESSMTDLPDLLKLEIRLAVNRGEQYRIELDLKAAGRVMNSLLGRQDDADFSWRDQLPSVDSFRQYEASGAEVSTYPLALKSFLMLESARHSEALSAERMRPSFEIGATWSVIGEPEIETGAVENGGDGVMVHAGFSLPLGYSGNRYDHSASLSSVSSAELTYSQELSNLASRKAGLSAEISGLINTYSLFETDILPNLEMILSLAESEWMIGQTELGNVIEVFSEFREAHLEMMSIYSQIVVSAAKLKELTGEETETGGFL